MEYSPETIVLIAFCSYLAVMVGIGLWSARQSHGSHEDYFLGGRALGPIVTALSAVSSGRSAWLIVGVTATTWSAGLSTIWFFPGYILAEAVMFVTQGPRLRSRSICKGAITLPEVFAGAPGSRGLPVRQVAAVITVLFLITYTGAQLVAGGKTLGVLFEIDGKTIGLLSTALIVLTYTVLGGYRAVAITDVIQALLMLASVLALPLLALNHLGGLDAMLEQLEAIDPALTSWSRGPLAIIGGIGIGLGSLGNPHILVRHMSLNDPGKARFAMLTGTTWNILMAAGAVLLGLTGRALFPTEAALGGEDHDRLFATVAEFLSNEYFGPVALGLMLASLFAAVMSTCDSQLLVIASSLLRDFRKQTNEGEGLGASRVAVAASLLVAVALTWGAETLVDPFVLFSWAALGAAFGPALILLLYDGRTTRAGVLAGMITGATTVVVWGEVDALHSLIYELVPAFFLALAMTFVVSRMSAGERNHQRTGSTERSA